MMKSLFLVLSLMFSGLALAKIQVKEECTIGNINFLSKTVLFQCNSGETETLYVPRGLFNYLLQDLALWSDNSDVFRLELAGSRLMAYQKQTKFGNSYYDLISRFMGNFDSERLYFSTSTGKLITEGFEDYISLNSLGGSDILTLEAKCPPKSCGNKVTVNH
jgi:hypothetical protein